MGMSGEAIGLTLLAVAEVPNFYSGLLPSLWTIGHFSETENEEANYWIRRGEVMASALTLAVGIATSVLTKSPLPMVGVIVMAGILLYLYEHALRNGSGADISNQ
jgi:hypothetical protein